MLIKKTAVYVFDTWLKSIREKGIKISYQCHDEWLANIEDKEKTKEIINTCIEELNNKLKLNVLIKCSIDFGENYASVH